MIKSTFIIICCFVIGVFFTACTALNEINNNDETQVWPNLPDTARIQYLAGFSSSAEITGNQSWFSKIIFGVSEVKNIIKPNKIIAKKGKLYICDQSKLHIIDLEKHRFLDFTSEGNGKFVNASSVAFDNSGNMILADVKKYKLLKYNSEGEFIQYYSDTINFKPVDVVYSENKLFVSNFDNHRIDVFDSDKLKLLYSIPDSALIGDKNYLYSPFNIAINNDILYVSDIGGCSVSIFDKNSGNFLSSFGRMGKTPGSFTRNKGIAVDHEGNVFVVDAAFANVQIFNKKNQLLMDFGRPEGKKGDMYMPFGIAIDYENSKYFEKYVDPEYDILYLIYVTNQFGSSKVSIYARIEPTKATPEEKEKRMKKYRKKKNKKKNKKYKGKSLI